MNAFFGTTNGFPDFQIIDLLIESRGVRLPCFNCNSNTFYFSIQQSAYYSRKAYVFVMVLFCFFVIQSIHILQEVFVQLETSIFVLVSSVY